MNHYVKCLNCGREAPLWSDDLEESYYICDCKRPEVRLINIQKTRRGK